MVVSFGGGDLGMFREESQEHVQQEIKCHPHHPAPGKNTPWVWSHHRDVSCCTILSVCCPTALGSVNATFPPPLRVGQAAAPSPVLSPLTPRCGWHWSTPGTSPSPAAPWQCSLQPNPLLSTDFLGDPCSDPNLLTYGLKLLMPLKAPVGSKKDQKK